MKPKLSVLIPVRNEPQSISIMVKVLAALVQSPHELLVITDSSEDTTIPVIHKLQKSYPTLRHIENRLGRGALNAIRAGVDQARGEYIMVYAADEMGPVLAIGKMVALMDQGCQFVSGTRYAKGGKRYGGSLIGHILSRTANALFNLLSATAFSDCTTGLKMFRKEVFQDFRFDPKGSGWSFSFDMAISAQKNGLRIGEVPIVSIDRLFGGQSSMRLGAWIISYSRSFIRGVKELPFWKYPRPKIERDIKICSEEVSDGV